MTVYMLDGIAVYNEDAITSWLFKVPIREHPMTLDELESCYSSWNGDTIEYV